MSILLSLQAVGSQAADQMPDLTAVTLPTEAEINVIDLAFKGGWIMVVLLLLSLMAIYIFVQRLIIIRRAGKEDETFMNRIKDYIHEGKVDSALNLCRSTNTSMPLPIWAPRQVSLRLSYLPWLVSARWYGSCAPRHSTKLH